MKRTIYFLIILFGCTSIAQEGIETIDARQFVELREKGVVAVDIRTKREYDQGHIPGVLPIDFFSDDFLIFFPKLASRVALGLGVIMLGATATHAIHSEWSRTLVTAILAGIWEQFICSGRKVIVSITIMPLLEAVFLAFRSFVMGYFKSSMILVLTQ